MESESGERVSYYKGCWVGLDRVMKTLHCSRKWMERIIAEAGVYVVRIKTGGRRTFCFISPDELRRLEIKYTSDTERERRMEGWKGKPNPFGLDMACPHCGKRGKMYKRKQRTTAGNSVAQCGYCSRVYTFNSTKLPPLKSTCPQCAATTGQWRRGLTSAGNLAVLCRHCKKNYTVKGNPDHVPQPAWVNPRRLTPEEEIAELRKRLAAGPTEWEIELHARRRLGEMEAFSARLDELMTAREQQSEKRTMELTEHYEQRYREMNLAGRQPVVTQWHEHWWRRDPANFARNLGERVAAIQEEAENAPETTLDKLRRLAESAH